MMGLSVWLFSLFVMPAVEFKEYRNMMRSTKVQFITSIQQASKKEQQTMLQATAHYERFKKSASLPAYYLNKARVKKAAEIYRTLSTDKLKATRRLSPANTPMRAVPLNQLNLNSLDNVKPKNRLTLQRTQDSTQHTPSSSQNSAWGQLLTQIRSFTSRFEELFAIRSEEAFTAQLEKSLSDIKARGGRKEELGGCLKALADCLARKERAREVEVRREFAGVSSELSNLQVQLKKKAIRAMLDQREVERQQTLSKELQAQLCDLRKKMARETKDASCGTDVSPLGTSDYQSLIFANTEVIRLPEEDEGMAKCRCDQLQINNVQLGVCMRKLRQCTRRQKELLDVLVLLRAKGVDVERIYEDVLQGRVEVPQQQHESLLNATQQARKRGKQQLKNVLEGIQGSGDYDADASLISSADGLSFDYSDMSMQDLAFTIRRQYKCQQQLSPALKQQLRLNLDLLYDQQPFSASSFSQNEDTI